MKKGQLTVFVILGLVVLILVGIFIFVVNKASDEQFVAETLREQRKITDVASFTVYVQSCLDSASKDSLGYVMKQGGFNDLPADSEVVFTNFISPYDDPDRLFGLDAAPYYIYGGEDVSPSLEEIESEIAERVQSEFVNCLDFEAVVEEFDFNLEYASPRVFVEINAENIIFSANMPLNISHRDSVNRVENFNYVMNYNLYDKILSAKEFVSGQVLNLDYYNVGLLSSIASENGFVFESTDISNRAVYIELYFPDYASVSGSALIYAFIVELN